MNRETIKNELKDIFHHIAPDIEFEALDLARPLHNQVDMDSMDFYRVLVDIHKRLGVNLPEAVLHELKNLNGLIDYIKDHAK